MLEFMPSTCSLFVVAVVLLITWMYMNTRRPPGMPPGPTPYPIIGNVPMLMGNVPPQKIFMDSTKTYGPIISIKFGSFWSVVINSYELVQEALLSKPNEFSGRPNMYLIDWFTDGQKDIAFAQPTATWKFHRKLAHTAIRKFATGAYLENLIDEVRPRLSDVMQSKVNIQFDPKEIITMAVYNVMASMCFGRKYEFNDPQLLKLVQLSKETNEDFGNGTAADFIPWLRFFPNPTLERVKVRVLEFFEIINKEVKSHLDGYDPDAPANDLIDLILQAQKEAASEEVVDANNELTDVHIKQIVSDLFSAGTDTTTITLLWGIGCLVDNPEVQEKIKTEIDDVIGDRSPRLSDRGKLPYMEAAIMEIMRFGTVAPLGLTHRAVQGSTIGPYKIPEDTWVFINHWALHNDPKYWDAPEVFRPERFLDSNTVKQRLPSFLPFSTGRRVCVGEALAKAEIFLIFSWLIQNYKFSKPSGVKGPVAVTGNPQGLNFPKPYEVIAVARE